MNKLSKLTEFLKDPFKNPKLKNILAILYILLIVVGFFYVRQTLKTGSQDIDSKQEEKDSIKTFFTTATLNINNGTTTVSHQAKLLNTNSVLDLLDALRNEKKLTYETTMYIYGTEISEVNGVPATDGYKWKVYFNNKDITLDINKTYITEKAKYDLKLELLVP